MRLGAMLRDWRRLVRYYLNGALNALVGYGLFAALLALGTNMYLAQIISNVVGVAFNYITFSRFTFADRAGSKSRFILAYAFNFALSLGTLAAVSRFIPSPYVAGLITVVAVSALNYFVLARLVFNRSPST